MTTDKNRLAWRCRRGMLELDLLLQGFLDEGYDTLPATQQALFEQLLALPDQMLFDYLLNGIAVDETEFVDVIEKIRAQAGN